MPTIEELQGQLAEKIQKLDEERRINAEQNAKERAELLIVAEAERAERIQQIKAGEAKALKRKLDEKAAEEARLKHEQEEKLLMEQKQNSLDEALRIQREKLAWLEEQFIKAEFTEEQHRKSLENSCVLPTLEPVSDDINVEHPEPPLNKSNPGEAVEGTDGLQDNPLMSAHLRQILRQATRQ